MLPPTLAAAWRAEQPNDVEVRRAYMRFLNKPLASKSPAVLVALGWMLAGMLLGVGSLFAASSAGLRIFERGAPSAEVAPAASVAITPPAVILLQAPALPAAPSAATSALNRAPEAEHPPRPATVTPAPASEPEQWRNVARAMREHDYHAADSALSELEGRGGSQAEAAQLVRAQLLLSQGRSSEAEVLLRALQTSAASPSVREKSAELLARPTKSGSPQRSVELPAGTK